MVQPHTSTEPGVWKAVIDGVLYGSDAEVATWIKERLGVSAPIAVAYVGFGIVEDDQLVGGVCYWNYQGGRIRDICCTVALADDVTLRRAAVVKILEYPFEQLGLPRVTAYIHFDNQRAIEQAIKMGFKLEGRMRQAGPDGADVGMFGLLASECPIWLQRGKAA